MGFKLGVANLFVDIFFLNNLNYFWPLVNFKFLSIQSMKIVQAKNINAACKPFLAPPSATPTATPTNVTTYFYTIRRKVCNKQKEAFPTP